MSKHETNANAGPSRKSARSHPWCYFSCSGTMCSTVGSKQNQNDHSFLSTHERSQRHLASFVQMCNIATYLFLLATKHLPCTDSWRACQQGSVTRHSLLVLRSDHQPVKAPLSCLIPPSYRGTLSMLALCNFFGSKGCF